MSVLLCAPRFLCACVSFCINFVQVACLRSRICTPQKVIKKKRMKERMVDTVLLYSPCCKIKKCCLAVWTLFREKKTSCRCRGGDRCPLCPVCALPLCARSGLGCNRRSVRVSTSRLGARHHCCAYCVSDAPVGNRRRRQKCS